MKIDGQEISEQTLEHVRVLQELLDSAAAVWAMVPGAEQNAINDLQSDFALGRCVYWGREAAEQAEGRILHEQLFGPDSTLTESPESPTLQLTGTWGTPLLARLILPGDGYGAWDKEAQQWAKTAAADAPPMIEFYDRRFAHTPFGQFATRYFVSTLLESNIAKGSGLMLDGGVADWRICSRSRRLVECWLVGHPLLQPSMHEASSVRPARDGRG